MNILHFFVFKGSSLKGQGRSSFPVSLITEYLCIEDRLSFIVYD